MMLKVGSTIFSVLRCVSAYLFLFNYMLDTSYAQSTECKEHELGRPVQRDVRTAGWNNTVSLSVIVCAEINARKIFLTPNI